MSILPYEVHLVLVSLGLQTVFVNNMRMRHHLGPQSEILHHGGLYKKDSSLKKSIVHPALCFTRSSSFLTVVEVQLELHYMELTRLPPIQGCTRNIFR